MSSLGNIATVLHLHERRMIMANSFELAHVDGINRELRGTGAVCKLSAVYQKSAVIGVPGVSGSVVVCLDFETTNHPDRGVWLCHHTDLDPKSASDGNVDFTQAEEEQFLYWGDLIRYLKRVFR